MTDEAHRSLVARDLVAALDALPDLGQLDAESLPAFRAARAGAPPVLDSDGEIEVREVEVPTPTGGTATGLLYLPASAGPSRPALLNIHGGGYVLGSPRREDAGTRLLVRALGCVALVPRYRLAPEHPHPAALDDCAIALSCLADQSDALGVDPARVAVRGVSAGGGLALGLALRTRDEGGPAIRHLQLIYPMVDDRSEGTQATGRLVWTSAANRFGWNSLLRGHDRDNPPAYAVPGRAPSVAGLPPVFVGVGSIDLFVGETLALAARLAASGVPVELHLYPGAYHGFAALSGTPTAEALRRDEIAALTRAFES